MFKAGDRVRRKTNGYEFVPVGYETTVVRRDNGWVWYHDRDGQEMHSDPEYWDLVTEGPVVTETVTKTRIVPGKYGIVQVGSTVGTEVSVSLFSRVTFDADQLDAAAAVLSALAKGLRDA